MRNPEVPSSIIYLGTHRNPRSQLPRLTAAPLRHQRAARTVPLPPHYRLPVTVPLRVSEMRPAGKIRRTQRLCPPGIYAHSRDYNAYYRNL
jgi:hypothetical protein